MSIAFISWDPNPVIVDLFGFPIRWYGFFFAMAFLAGFRVVSYMFKQEGRSTEQADQLLMYTMVATIVGARAGHYFFYEFPLLQADPLRFFLQMITPPFSGLASHGAAIGLFIAFYLYARKNAGMSYLYITDRIVPAVALAGFFIRMGNLMNSEIIGKPTELPWGFKFLRDTEFNPYGDPNLVLARHPSQLYEALSCLLIFALLMWFWSKKKKDTQEGLMTGSFMVVLFTLRFFYEFLKENQSAFENNLTLNMGQILSIPAVLFGLIVLAYSFKKAKA
ncbi:prolipoprotein diacylglyceryl transferase [Aquirufa regiilacus]|uniref:Phosphatidylglycerol--prolipoprotein diacylglyceryl transferase n=1 Tax=Aquirufa regiilacus TaxID=3024868 RepID=A0ABU3TPI3_9BACT|nr:MULTISPECIES: prolipoprotein diacylglyceryl transferase [unclassified Aquirufa]MDT8886979.1 prolipoprotein diacylglyceryl transferase [Aquirufa sp. LEPPI-3A]MDU0807744.1 prolipoprotein diacylglyceryl transferase [Aquirufa sp. LEOWEIH-7C]